ncbi:MAG: helix-turn-helix domain-containing protein [Bacteroidales bacterium]
MNINSRLAEIRVHFGLNQTQMSAVMGVKQSTYSKYEKVGGKIPDYSIIILEAIYKVNPTWLRSGQGERFNEETTHHSEAIQRNAINETNIQNLKQDEEMDLQTMNRMLALLETQTKNVTELVKTNQSLGESMKTIAFEIMHLNQHFHADEVLGGAKNSAAETG